MKSISELLPTEFIEKERTLVITLIIIFTFLLTLPFLMFDLKTAIEIVMIGASTGALYSILSLGFSLIFGVAKQLKLSVGAYYVIGSYTMFFLLMAGKVVPAFRVFEGNQFNIDGVLLLFIIALPILLSIIIIVFLWKILNNLDAVMIFIGTLASISILLLDFLGVKTFQGTVIQVTTVEGLYVLLVIPLIALALWYLEVSNRLLAVISLIFGVMIPILIFFDLPMIYLSFLILSVFFTAFLAMLSDRFFLDKFRYSPINVLIVTFAIALVIQSIIPLIPYPADFGREFLPLVIVKDLPGIVRTTENIDFLFGAKVGLIDMITLVFSVLSMILLYFFIYHTKIGMSLRAVSQDEEAAALVGINIRKVTAIVSGVGMGLIGFAGVLTSPYRAIPSWNPNMGWFVLILAIAIVTFGGIGSLPGTVVAAFMFAYVEIIVSSFISSYSVILPFMAVILVMIFRPEGIHGEKEVLEA